MADDDLDSSLQTFDPTKKKKKKKKPFDPDSVFADSNAPTEAPVEEKKDETPVEINQEDLAESIDDLDLESFGKKKKKSKKVYKFDDLDNASLGLDSKNKEEGESKESKNEDDEINLAKEIMGKKKKKKKKAFDEIMAEEEGDEDASVEDPAAGGGTGWAGSDRDYTYDELLNRVFDIMREKNPDMVAGEKRRFIMRPPQVLRVGTKKTSFANFTEICKTLHRQPKHLLQFLLAELGTSGSVDGNSHLIIKGRFQQKQIETVLRRYIKEYVTCHTCRSAETILQKDTRLFFLQCESCGSRCSVTSIKSGYQAVTGKRAAQRAKNA